MSGKNYQQTWIIFFPAVTDKFLWHATNAIWIEDKMNSGDQLDKILNFIGMVYSQYNGHKRATYFGVCIYRYHPLKATFIQYEDT